MRLQGVLVLLHSNSHAPVPVAVLACAAQLNGTANVTLMEQASKGGVPRFTYISAHIPNLPGIGAFFGSGREGARPAGVMGLVLPCLGTSDAEGLMIVDRQAALFLGHLRSRFAGASL